jgi:hypothetical protein
MDSFWEREFRHRMNSFSRNLLRPPESIAVSIKVRVTSGCFHRDHSLEAYKIIDNYLASYDADDVDYSFEEHESGPELLVYLALGTAGITLAKSIIELVTAIIKARSEGIKKGDSPDEPLEIIVRGIYEDGKYYEETILRIGPKDPLTVDKIQSALQKTADNIAKQKSRDAKKKRKK